MNARSPEVARTLGMKVVLGAWIDRDEAASGRELDTALRLAREHADLVCVSMQNALEDWKTEQNARRKAAAQEAKSA